jgi:molybdenum cofactor cytidylyltransferase
MAAGGSKRLDSPKQLLRWGNEYLINHMINIANASSIQQLYVVLGSRFEQIQPVIDSQDAVIVRNPDWQKGLSSSIKAGLSVIADDMQGAFILLVDQPFLTAELLDRMIVRFSQADAQAIAPRVNGQQCNPVLFRREVFEDLMKVSGDKGAKAMLDQFTIEWVDWPDERLRMDIDSLEDYQAAIGKDQA